MATGNAAGDIFDWNEADSPQDACNRINTGGQFKSFSQTDIDTLDAIGWQYVGP